METDRLVIRPWTESDQEPFAAMNADERVMEYFPNVLSGKQSNALVRRAQEKTETDGFCFQPIILKTTNEFLGFVGLSRPSYPQPLPFDPCVEIGWRLTYSAWGHGYATEAAKAWIGFGFETLDLAEIVSFTAKLNRRSQAVMMRLGMNRLENDDFFHPMIDISNPLALHVLYRLPKNTWTAKPIRFGLRDLQDPERVPNRCLHDKHKS